MGRHASLAPLAERRFRLVFIADTIAYVGSAATPVALSFGVLQLTHSAVALGGVNAANTIPLVVFVLLGGVAGDRLRRGRILVGSSLLAAASRFALAVLVISGSGRSWSLAVCAAVGGLASAFFLPTSQAVIPELVSADHLREANALLRLTRSGTQVLGGAVGGLAVATIGAGWALAWDGASSVVAAVLLAGLRLSTSAPPTGHGIWTDLRLGWSEFWSRPWLWGIVVQFCFVNAAFAAGFELLGPVIALRSLDGAKGWGLVLTGLALGYVIGGFIALRWRASRPLLVGTFGVLVIAAPMAALAARAPLWLVVAAAFLGGIGLELFGVGWSTAMGRHIPADRLSRVSSYDMLGSFVFLPVGYAVGGPISSAIGISATVWGATAVTVIATLAVLLVRQVRTMPAGAWPEGEPGLIDEEV